MVLLVFNGSFSRVIVSMVSGLTSDSYNYFFRNFGFSKVEAAEGVFLPEYSDFGMFFWSGFGLR